MPEQKKVGFWKRLGNALANGLATILMAGTGAGSER